MTSEEEKEIDNGNILLSKYLYGEQTIDNYYQVGYRDTNCVYRHERELHSNFYSSFHNNWDFLMGVVAKIAKDKVEDFSDEDKLIDRLKNTMFQFSYDKLESFKICVEYAKLKMLV